MRAQEFMRYQRIRQDLTKPRGNTAFGNEGDREDVRDKPPAGNSHASQGMAIDTGLAVRLGAALCKAAFGSRRAASWRVAGFGTMRAVPPGPSFQ